MVKRLAADVPAQQGVAIAHGDYRFGNCLIDVTTGRVNAVLDWELCTLGDPLADVGYLGVYWTDPSRPGQITDPTGAGGFPSFDEIVEMYASKTGRDLSGIDYYVAFSSFRLAVISEGVYSRYLNGAMGDDVDPEVLAMFRDGAEDLAGKALTAIGGGA